MNQNQPGTVNKLSLLVQSFGFKHGLPIDADFIFDVRCLPNPYWEKNLRYMTGLETDVAKFFETYPEVHKMFEMIKDFIEYWIPNFEKENRNYLTIAIGCTGGQHRSVYIAEQLGQYFAQQIKNVTIRHRDNP